MSIKELLITNNGDADYGKIAPRFIPSSIHPTYATQSLVVNFNKASFNPITITTDALSGNQNINFATDPIPISANFNYTASKYNFSLVGYFDIIGADAIAPTFTDRVGISNITLNGISNVVYLDSDTKYQIFETSNDPGNHNKNLFFNVAINDYIANPLPVNSNQLELTFALNLAVNNPGYSPTCNNINFVLIITPTL